MLRRALDTRIVLHYEHWAEDKAKAAVPTTDPHAHLALTAWNMAETFTISILWQLIFTKTEGYQPRPFGCNGSSIHMISKILHAARVDKFGRRAYGSSAGLRSNSRAAR